MKSRKKKVPVRGNFPKGWMKLAEKRLAASQPKAAKSTFLSQFFGSQRPQPEGRLTQEARWIADNGY